MARGIDHIVLAVNNLDDAAARYTALGFSLTPRARHPFGTANRLIQLDKCFLELLEVDHPELIGPSQVPPGFAAFNRDFLEQHEGFSMLVLEAPNAEATRDALIAAGLTPRDVFTFERDAIQPDGAVARVRFDLVFVDYPGATRAGFFTCSQHRPELFWKPQYQTHENGAQSVRLVTMEAPDPAPLAEFLGKFAGITAAMRGSGFVVDTPRGRVEVKLGGACPQFTRFVIETSNIGIVRDRATVAGIRFRERPQGIEFGPDVMYGVEVGFVAV